MDEVETFIKEGYRNPLTRQETIMHLKLRFRYYGFQAGILWQLSEKRELTQAEQVRQDYYRQHPSYEP